MADLTRPSCLAAGTLVAVALLQPAWGERPRRAVLESVPGVQVSYERFGKEGEAAAPGRFEGALATPAGTLRTTVRAEPGQDQPFVRGDSTLQLPGQVLGGQFEVRERHEGGNGARWWGKLGAGLAAEAQGEHTPVRSAQGVQLRQALDYRLSAQARVDTSRTTEAQGSRWNLELSHAGTFWRWTAGLDRADRSYVSAGGGLEPREGVRLNTQLPVWDRTRIEARFTRQVRWDNEEPLTTVMLGTRFELTRRLSLVTGVEADNEARRKATATLTVPLEVN